MRTLVFILLIVAIGSSLLATLVYHSDVIPYYRCIQAIFASLLLVASITLYLLNWRYHFIIVRTAAVLAVMELIDEYTGRNIAIYTNDRVILISALLITLYLLYRQWKKHGKKSERL